MSIAMELENLALGEVTLEEGSKTVRAVLAALDVSSAGSLYEALRSWTWKALEARRRDDELQGWMDMLSRASSHMASVAADLALKIEAYIELLQASVMTAAAAAQQDPLERKHVRSALVTIYRSEGRLRRRDLMVLLGLKAPNLSRVMTPLQDHGYVMREVDGREIFYRLTLKGRSAVAALMAHEAPAGEVATRQFDHLAKIVAIVPLSQTLAYRDHAKGDRADPFLKYHILSGKIGEPVVHRDHDDLFDVAQDFISYGGVLQSEEKHAMRLTA